MEEIDIEVRPDAKIPFELDEYQTVENDERGDPEEYDYSCYR